MRRGFVSVVLAAVVAGCGGEEGESVSRETATPARTAVSLKRVVTGLRAPVHAAAPRSEPGRVYVVEQAGRIVVVQGGRIRSRPFLDIRSLVSSGGERGLLSVAFHPRYAENRRFYVNYTDRNGHTRVVEYRSNGVRAILSSARRLVFIEQPYANHNGGQVAFGPDGRLYVGMGDGGSGGDPEDRAQNLGSLLGKLLAVDVDKAGADPAIEALGLRNPWRFSFDRATGDLYIGDVGQGSWEEIDYTRRADLPGRENYGWDVYEGRARFEEKEPSRGDLVFPIAVYPLGSHCAVAGGFVYRGAAVPAVRGRYFYGDYCTGTVWSLKVAGGKATGVRQERFRVSGLTSFGEDARGELYLVSHQGTVFRLAR